MRLWQRAEGKTDWMGWVVGIWIGFTVAAVIKVLVQPNIHTVYPVFAEGARNWWRGVSLYEFAPDRDLFRYSPTFAVLMTPFALLPDWLGGVAWVGVNVGLLFGVLRRAAGEVFPSIDDPDREAVWLLLTLAGAARSLWAGQSNCLILVGAIGAMLAIRRGRWWTAAFLLTGGGFIKVWPWALALLAGACWPRQLAIRMAAAAGVWAALPFLTKPPETVVWQYGQWLQMLQTTQIYRWGGYRDAWTIWELIQFPVPRNLYELVQCQTALAVLAWCLWQRQQLGSEWGHPRSFAPSEEASEQSVPSKEAPDVRRGRGSFISCESCTTAEPGEVWFGRLATDILGAWAAWQLLFGPGTERLTYILIAPMAAWAVLASWRSRRYRALAGAAWILIFLFSMGALERWVLQWSMGGRALLPLGVAVFVVWLILHETCPGPIWRKRSLSGPESAQPSCQIVPKAS